MTTSESRPNTGRTLAAAVPILIGTAGAATFIENVAGALPRERVMISLGADRVATFEDNEQGTQFIGLVTGCSPGETAVWFTARNNDDKEPPDEDEWTQVGSTTADQAGEATFSVSKTGGSELYLWLSVKVYSGSTIVCSGGGSSCGW
jgi:hypothetical protein